MAKKETSEKKKGLTSQCSKCKKHKFVNPQAHAARIKKYGSDENIAKEWTCRGCTPKKEKATEEKKVSVVTKKDIREKSPAVKRALKVIHEEIKEGIPVYEEPTINQDEQ